MLLVVICYLTLMNIVAFLAYGIDKWKAKHARWRIPEATLLLLAFAGGSLGALMGMKVWRHKTMHKKFTLGVPAILLFHLLLAAFWFWGM